MIEGLESKPLDTMQNDDIEQNVISAGNDEEMTDYLFSSEKNENEKRK